jgi:hypothetical protein
MHLRYARPTRELDPAERLLAGIVRLAIRDAQQEKDRRLREEAATFLWDVAPGVAASARLPRLEKVGQGRE